jgi:hypothetical protein
MSAADLIVRLSFFTGLPALKSRFFSSTQKR